ncbi:hypothetical protein HJC23_010384 [Cyclotella cryptica]|uniref:Chlorophyllase n=1 Tax=Cyclotella cryptica TaxID=29204 RepID=A0ABD3QH74_9STRA|eukprot:CCRYP_005235-RA/>CCRYP_005235-RA protein AED:0.01 eAED:0.01 QI:105/0.5/0.33/1/0.5/0.33/3/6515/438
MNRLEMTNMAICSIFPMLTRLLALAFLLMHRPSGADAFSITRKSHISRTSKGVLTIPIPLRSQYGDDAGGNENKASDAIGGDLVTALARLDRKWELAQKNAGGGKKIGEWTLLDVSITSDDGDSPKPSSPEIVYLLEPSSGATPSCVIFFLGGAVLGQFPHISYSTFLQRLAAKMNASVIAIPYEIGLDHFSIAQRAVNRMKNAVIQCEDSRGYPESLPKYAIGHSLGAKLHAIGIAATGIGEELAGAGFISYNNFGFAETIRMSRTFAKELQVGGFQAGSGMPFDTLINFAEMAVSAVGLEFSPSPSEMDRILTAKFDENILPKTRIFVFDDDELDSCKGFLQCFENGNVSRPSVSYLPGTHLTPVYLKLGLEDLPDEARDMASTVTGGFQKASFGNEEALDMLIDEVYNWMIGKGPSDRRANQKQISGSIDAEIEE